MSQVLKPARSPSGLPDIDLWVFSTDMPVERSPADYDAAMRRLLSPADERHFSEVSDPLQRRRRLAGRALLRQVLGLYLNVEPATIGFYLGRYGKPWIEPPLSFNLARVDDIVAIAISDAPMVGIDITRPDATLASSVRDYLLPVFPSGTTHLGDTAGIFNSWTVLEAVCKASGDGLSNPSLALTLSPTGSRVEETGGKRHTSWQVSRFRLFERLVGAVATEASDGAPDYDPPAIRLRGAPTQHVDWLTPPFGPETGCFRPGI